MHAAPLRSCWGENDSRLSPKSQRHAEMAWLLVWAANLSNVNVGSRVSSASLTRNPSAAFCSFTFQHRVFQVFQTAPDKPRDSPLYSRRYYNQKPVQAKLAIIQQTDEFYPDSFIFFFFSFFLKKYWWLGFVCKEEGELGLGLCFNSKNPGDTCGDDMDYVLL